MFSTIQVEMLSSLVPTMAANGYKYYVAYTYTRTNDSSWGYEAQPDLYVVFSQDKITASNGYTYSVSHGAVRYAIRTANYSSSSSANNRDRIVKEPFSGVLRVDLYEHIYSNAEYAAESVVMPDINYRGGGKQLEKTNALGLVSTAVLLFIVFVHVFKR